MVFLDVMIALLGLGIFMSVFFFFGRYLPQIPILNDWRVRALVYEVRGNGLFPKWDSARNSKDLQGNPIFELKKTNIRTPPKKLIDAQRGTDGRDYITLIQVSRDSVLSVKPKFFKNVREIIRDSKGNPARMNLKLKQLDELELDNIVKDENVYKWKEQMMRDHARKVAIKPDDYLSKIANFTPILTIIGVAIFFILMVEPVNNYFAAANTLTTRMEGIMVTMGEVQKVNLQVVEALAPIAQAFGNGG